MSNISNPKYKLPNNLNVTTVTASSGFKGDLFGTSSYSSDSVKLGGQDINYYASKTDITGALIPYAKSLDVSSSFTTPTQVTGALTEYAKSVDVSSSFAELSTINTFTQTNNFTQISASGVTGSFKGSGSEITNITASNIDNFSNDVRSLFSAGTGLSYSQLNGQFDFNGTLTNVSDITGSQNITIISNGSQRTASLNSNIDLNSVTASFIKTEKIYNGDGVDALGFYTHAEGRNTKAIAIYSHAEGRETVTTAEGSHAEGYQSTASGDFSHAEGFGTSAKGYFSHSEGNKSIASGNYSYAAGQECLALGEGSRADGTFTTASGEFSHAEGFYSLAIGEHSHAEGYYTIASGNYSHAEGNNTYASGTAQHVMGINNAINPDPLVIVGNGIFDETQNIKSNIVEIYKDRLVTSGSVYSTDLSGSSTRVVYADTAGKLTVINNTYTYDTANILASYKIRLSGSSTTSGSIFTVPADKSMFIPIRAVLIVESGSFGSGAVSVGHSWGSNEMFYQSSIPSGMVKQNFIEIPLRSALNSSAPTSSQTVYCELQGGTLNTYTASLNIVGYYI